MISTRLAGGARQHATPIPRTRGAKNGTATADALDVLVRLAHGAHLTAAHPDVAPRHTAHMLAVLRHRHVAHAAHVLRHRGTHGRDSTIVNVQFRQNVGEIVVGGAVT